MKIQTLDAHLRALTKQELKNRSGDPFCYDSFPVAGFYKSDPYYCFDLALDRETFEKEYSFTYRVENLLLAKQARFQAVPLHIHKWIELNYMYSGECTLTVNGASYVLKEGQVSLINTNAPHSVSACGENDILINFLIRQDYLDGNFFSRLAKDNYLATFFIEALASKNTQDNYIIFHSEKSTKLPVYINYFLCEYQDNSIAADSILDCLMTLVLCELINVFENDLSREQQQHNAGAVIPIVRYIEHNYNHCTLKSTASFFNMHPNYLSAYLKRHTGMTYKELVQKQRFQQAVLLLKSTSMSVYDISVHVGYSNTSFFFQKFREAYGCTPKEYRDRYLAASSGL